MRHIHKGKEPQAFTDWKASKSKKRERPRYSELVGAHKKVLKLSLLKEQRYICCYCEKQIDENNSHIEHLNPRSKKEGDDVDYNNLLCSCMGEPEESEEKTAIHCGHKKAAHSIAVHPLQENCCSQFTFTGAGEIEGVNKEARATIKTLGLDVPTLVDMRRKAIEPFLDCAISDEESQKFATGYIQAKNGKFNPCISAVAFVFGLSNKSA